MAIYVNKLHAWLLFTGPYVYLCRDLQGYYPMRKLA